MFGAVCNRVLSWASDGADRSVGELAVRDFKNMAFREWEESHSGVKLLPHALAADEEFSLVEKLLLSVAKFLSTSDVFRRRFGDSLLRTTVSWVQNFGWAPQRYTSRSRPLSREARRWDPIFESLCEEAGSANERGLIAWHLVRELGGVNSPRLLLGGMLTDIAVEHYGWVAGGDKQHPDPTTATDRANLFLDRLSLLFDEGMVLTMADTYTGSVMEFLRKGKLFQVRGHSLCVGLGDPADPDVKNMVATVLRKARQIVANIRVYMNVYRNPKGWLYRFRAFRFPSPLLPSAPEEAKKEAMASLTHILRVAGLSNRAMPELLQLLPRATFHAQSADSAKAAWGRSSAEFPELKDGRSAVNCFMAFVHAGPVASTTYSGFSSSRVMVQKRNPGKHGLRCCILGPLELSKDFVECVSNRGEVDYVELIGRVIRRENASGRLIVMVGVGDTHFEMSLLARWLKRRESPWSSPGCDSPQRRLKVSKTDDATSAGIQRPSSSSSNKISSNAQKDA